MARGAPVIAIKSGGPTESVKDKKTGFLLEISPKDWAEQMEKIQNDNKLREKISLQAAKYACEEFSLSSMAQKLDKSLSALVIKKT